MKINNNSSQLTTLAASLLIAYTQIAVAEEDKVAELTKSESSVSIGIGNWSEQRLHQGTYDGMWDDGVYGSVDASIIMRDDDTGTWKTLSARNLGLDSLEFGGGYEKQGDWGVSLDYSQTPRQNPVVVNTGLQGIGSSRQTITNVTAGAGTNTNMDVQRDALSMNAYKYFKSKWDFRVKFKNEDKNGDRQWGVRAYPTSGSTSGSAPAFIAEPINSNTRQIDALLNYNSEKLHLTGGYYGSWYNNHEDRLDVIGTAGGVTEISLPPDNEAHQLYIKGNYAFAPTTRGMFKLAYAHAIQNDPFISTTNNGVASWAPKATVGSSLQGEVNTLEAMVGVTARPMPKLSVLANVRYWDKNDKTPVRVDASNSGNTIFYHNNPFQHTRTSAKVEGTYRAEDGYSVTAGIDYTHQLRSISDLIVKTTEIFVPYRTEVDETTYRVELRRSLSERVNGSVGYSYSTRDGSSYDNVSVAVDTATITPFYIADRDRSKLKAALDWTPVDALGIQLAFAHSEDKYPEDGARVDGVRKGTAQLFSLDAHYAFSDKWQMNAWYSHDTNEIDQTGPLTPAPAVWNANIDDSGDSVGFGINGSVTAKVHTGMNADWTRTTSKYEQTGTSTPLADINNRITRVGLFASYTLQKNSLVRLDLIREIWKTDDWSWTFRDGSVFNYNDGTQVIAKQDQTSTFVGVRYMYKF